MTGQMSQWVGAFMAEWCRLCEGRADAEQVAEFAKEIYASRKECDPVEVAAEMWDGGPGPDRESRLNPPRP
ncbi:hypothetical protein J7E62_25330 [Variovorax paradoxus]|nr:hypothetical protein [Variovorax paradoxus]